MLHFMDSKKVRSNVTILKIGFTLPLLSINSSQIKLAVCNFNFASFSHIYFFFYIIRLRILKYLPLVCMHLNTCILYLCLLIRQVYLFIISVVYPYPYRISNMFKNLIYTIHVLIIDKFTYMIQPFTTWLHYINAFRVDR